MCTLALCLGWRSTSAPAMYASSTLALLQAVGRLHAHAASCLSDLVTGRSPQTSMVQTKTEVVVSCSGPAHVLRFGGMEALVELCCQYGELRTLQRTLAAGGARCSIGAAF